MRCRSVLLGLVLSLPPCTDAFNVARSYLDVSQPIYAASQTESVQDVSKTSDHPHEICWSSTLDKSPNSYVHPSVQLAIRPPAEGGTGIIATEDIPADTIVLSLRLEEVGMMDATAMLNGYKKQPDQNDEVMNMLCEMWEKELMPVKKSGEESEEGKRLAVLAGLLAHLQLVRYKDLTSWVTTDVKEGYVLDTSRTLGPFLDAMPLIPQKSTTMNPFPTHFLFWTDEEIEHLLAGTIAQTKAREVRAGVGLILREWSASFLKKHSPAVSQKDILNAIFSSFAAVLSRSFGDAAGRDLDGKGRMLVPIVDMLNHDGETPNVSWKWHVGVGDEVKIEEGKGDIAVTTLIDVKKGEELRKCYGWRPGWDIASSYGFVPRLIDERWECSVIPLFPAVLDLAPSDISSPTNKADDNSKLDLTMESNYGPLVQACLAAVNAAEEIKVKMNLKDEWDDEIKAERPHQLNRIEVLSLFRPPPAQTAQEFPFQRRQPVINAGTKIDRQTDPQCNKVYHKLAIKSILPIFKAAASAIFQLRNNYHNNISAPIEASQMAKAASIDQDTNWDVPALALMQNGIDERINTLLENGKDAELWLQKVRSQEGADDRMSRAGLARDVREAELRVLEKLRDEVSDLSEQ